MDLWLHEIRSSTPHLIHLLLDARERIGELTRLESDLLLLDPVAKLRRAVAVVRLDAVVRFREVHQLAEPPGRDFALVLLRWYT